MKTSTILMACAIACASFAFPPHLHAQLNLNWQEIGPNNKGNHVRAIAVDPNGTVWAGSVGGGLWKSTNRGVTWWQVPSLSDNLAVSCIVIEGNNLYVGTGETHFYKPDNSWAGNWSADSIPTYKQGFLKYAGQPGEGVFVSNDGGNSWSHSNGTWNSTSLPYQGNFSSIQRLRAKNGRVLIATLKGVYWSDDASLNTVTQSNGTPGLKNGKITDLIFANGSTVYAATSDSIYRSTDGGQTFGSSINASFPVSQTVPYNKVGGDGILLAVAPSNDNILYVAGVNSATGNCSGVWRSIDNGYAWTMISPFESATFRPFQGKGRYASLLEVAVNDPAHIYIGGTALYEYSEKIGWQTAASHNYVPGFSTRYVPSPQLALALDAQSDSSFYVGTDHEIVRTDNLGRTYSIKTKGFNNAHLYSVSASPSWKVLVGDRYDGVSYKDNSLNNTSLQQFRSSLSAAETGGGLARWSMSQPNYAIASRGGDRGLLRSMTGGDDFEQFYAVPQLPFHPSFGVSPSNMYIDRETPADSGSLVMDRAVAPIMPFYIEETIPTSSLGSEVSIKQTPIHVYMCTNNYVWVVRNPFGGVDSLPTWNRISEDLIANALPGGKHEHFTAITASGDADHDVYVGTNLGKIYRLHNAHDPVNFDVTTQVVRIDQGLPARWVTDLQVDPTNTNNLLITYGAYALGDDRVYLSIDAKLPQPSFTSLHANLADDLPVYKAAFSADPNSRAIFLGTENGLYSTVDAYESGTVTWHDESNGMGKVPVTDIFFRPYYLDYTSAPHYKYVADNTLFVATHGRGAFKSTTLVAKDVATFVESGIRIEAGPNPSNSSCTISMELPLPTHVKLEAYSIDGRSIGVLADQTAAPGLEKVTFVTKNLSPGLYLVKADFHNSQGDFSTNLRVVVAR